MLRTEGAIMKNAEASPESYVAADWEVAEVHLLLAEHELAALEWAARRRGLTSAQLLRHLIRSFLKGRKEAPG